jgi:hypothetical protein
VNHYDGFAEAYSAETENNLVNAYYERPAMLVLAGDVADVPPTATGSGDQPVGSGSRDRSRPR